MANISAFRARIGDIPVYVNGEEGYAEHIATWNTYTSRRPLALVQPSTAAQIGTVLKAAKLANISQITVRGGGHSFEALGLGGTDGALVIDVIRLNGIASDPSTDTITAGGGALLGTVAQYAWDHGKKMLPMGTCPTVGLGGQIQCGGYGFSTRTFGTLTDRVIDLEVVTADGEIRHANNDENSDLFFALRGSGTGCFGVITNITLRTNDAPAAAACFSVKWKLSRDDIREALIAAVKNCGNAPLSVNPMIISWLGVLEISGTILAQTPTERDVVWSSFLSQLPHPDEAACTPRPFIDTVADIGLTQTSAPWYPDLRTLTREGMEHERFMKIKAGFMPEIPSEAFLEELAELIVTQPASGVRVQLLGLNPKFTPAPDTTSIKVRGAPWLMGMSVWLPLEEYGGEAGVVAEAERRLPWLTKAYELFYPLTNGGYLGDDDYDEALHGRDMMESYYGNHLPRLRLIKAKYDPGNMFHHPLSIQPIT